jgi:hypothetical protein
MASQSIIIRMIEALEPCPIRDVCAWNSGLQGFGVQVTPRGVKSYVLQFHGLAIQAC